MHSLFINFIGASIMGINVQVNTDADPKKTTVSASGSIQHVITGNEVNSFGLSDSALKDAVAKYFGKRPNDAYLKSPTPWGDLYKTYGWEQVQTVLVARSAQVLSVNSSPSIIKTVILKNNSNKPATFNASVSDNITNSVETNWNVTTSVDFSETVSYEVSFEGLGSVGGSTTWSFGMSFGVGGSKSESISIGSDQGVTVDLDPGESVEVQLTASIGSLRARVFYDVYLTGYSAVNYNPTFKDHHFWALNIGDVMSAGGISNNRQITEDITVGYYSNAQVILSNAKKTVLRALAVPLENSVPVDAG
ncbi:hypothetical protein HMPREF0880_03544 [Yokenella regensburgei ATCC 43003]|jgi:hypothetical protein|nr:hypothetical protein HMPREF0880_03544 [Yokenella regensburgei ATCC 43003]